MKPIYFLMTAAGVGGSIVAQLVGGWTYALTVLCILMALDYLSGLIVTGVFHASPKSLGGGLEHPPMFCLPMSRLSMSNWMLWRATRSTSITPLPLPKLRLSKKPK